MVEKEAKNESGKKSQIIVFRLGTEEYGLMIDQVKEVVVTPNITKVPLTAPYIIGVANIRGHIFSIIDLEEKLGLKNGLILESKSVNYTIVLENDSFKIGILVNELPNTLSITASEIDDANNILHDSDLNKNFIKGIVKHQKRLIILIDIYAIISKEDISETIKLN